MDSLETISPQQAASRLNLSPHTVRKWCDAGLLPSKRLPSGRIRISVTDLSEFYRSLPSGQKNAQIVSNRAQ